MKKMMTACAAGMLCAMAISATAFASPLKNYDAGKVALDAGINLPTSVDVEDYKLSKSNSGYFGGTLGLGSNMALNYKWNSYKFDNGDTATQQVNLMYKVLPGISAYVGYLNADTDFGPAGNANNSGQVGLQASYDIPLLFTVWGNVAVGNKNKGYEIGLSKPILNNVELNASYYDHKFDDAIGSDGQVNAKGVNLGVTLKF